ncbi:MAG: hypothetical protein K2G55_09435, partial [Lachnospiraceae bacterium]|nr:hypothetical protein [Lachnospiraceae bacterium]
MICIGVTSEVPWSVGADSGDGVTVVVSAGVCGVSVVLSAGVCGTVDSGSGVVCAGGASVLEGFVLGVSVEADELSVWEVVSAANTDNAGVVVKIIAAE